MRARVTDRGWGSGDGRRVHGKRNTCERIKKISNINAQNIENGICTITRANVCFTLTSCSDAIQIAVCILLSSYCLSLFLFLPPSCRTRV